MKRFTVMVCLLASVLIAQAQVFVSDNGQSDFYFALTTNLSSGSSLAITNSPTSVSNAIGLLKYPFRIGGLIVKAELPNTNSFTVTIERDIKTVLYSGDVVRTNQFDEVETNNYHVITNTVTKTFTNTMYTSMAYTNSEIVLDSSVFPSVYSIGGDRIKVNITNTRSSETFVALYGLR